MVSERLSDPPANLLCCSQPDCSIHDSLLDGYADHIMNTFLDCALRCLPCRTISPRKIVGWNNPTWKLKKASVFWHKVWEEAGCPTSGVLSSIKRHAKKGTSMRSADSSAGNSSFFVTDLHDLLQGKRKGLFLVRHQKATLVLLNVLQW